MASPVINIQPSNQQVIIDGTLNLSIDASDALNYAWYQGASPVGTDSSVYQKVSFSSADRGFYRVYVSNGDGTTVSDDATVSVQPVISVQPISQAVTIGGTASLPIGFSSSYGPTYQWFKNGSPIAGADGNPLDLTPFADSSRGVYKVVVYDDGNDTTSNDATITTRPNITVQPVSQSFSVGTTAGLDVTATGYSTTYQWLKTDATIADATFNALNLTPYADSSAGVYKVVVYSDNLDTTSNDATVTTQKITVQPVTQAFTLGSVASLDVTATSQNVITYQWLKTGSPISDATFNALDLTPYADSSRGVYNVVVSFSDGNDETSSDATLTVQPLITVQPASALYLIGADSTLTVTATGHSPITYQWIKGVAPISDATFSSYVLTPYADSSRGVYKVAVVSDENDTTSNDATIGTQIIFTTTPDKTATEGTLYTYSPATNIASSSWSLTGIPVGTDMTLNPIAGVINWTPSYDRTNSGSLHLTGFSTDSSATQDWTIAVNYVTPSITSTPGGDATEGVGYSYTPTATVVDLDRWALTGSIPSGMTLNNQTGKVDWTPSYDLTSTGLLTLAVYSLNGLNTSQDWTIGVQYVAPVITNSPGTDATEGTGYSYTPTATVTDFWKYDLTGAPAGMTVSSTTGKVDWTASYDRTNSGPLTLTLRSLNGLTDHKDWTVAVSFVTPVITNSPRTDATEHVAYTYTPTATVVDFWKYDLTGAPTGMTVNPTSGVVAWTPNYDQTNSGALTLTLRSLNDLTSSKDWTVAVTMIAPVITNTPGVTATEGVAYTYTPTKTAQDFWRYDLTGAPTGMTHDHTTGAISWTPNYDQSNSGALTLTLYDYNNLTDHKDWTVASPYITPVITSTPDNTAYTDVNYSYVPTGTVTHFNTWSLLGAPSGMTFDPLSGAIGWIPDADQSSSGTLVLSLKSLNGLQGDQTFTLTVFPEPATTGTSQAGMHCVSPFGRRYSVRNVWVLDSNTNLPVGVRQEYDFD